MGAFVRQLRALWASRLKLANAENSLSRYRLFPQASIAVREPDFGEDAPRRWR